MYTHMYVYHARKPASQQTNTRTRRPREPLVRLAARSDAPGFALLRVKCGSGARRKLMCSTIV